MAANGISTLSTKEDRQIAKLTLAQTKRQLAGTAGYRALRYLDITELPTVYSGNTVVNNPNVGGLKQGRPWRTTPLITSGLWRTTYDGYFNDGGSQGDRSETAVAWFDTTNVGIIESIEVTDFSLFDGNIYSTQWLGFFRAPHTANYTFYSESDDETYFWIGNKAVTGYTAANADLYSWAGGPEQTTDPIELTEGQYYPIRLQYGNAGGPAFLNFSWSSDFVPQLIQTGLVVQLNPADYATTPDESVWVNRQTGFPMFNASTSAVPAYNTIDVVCWNYNGPTQFWDIPTNPTSGDFTASIWFNTLSTEGTGAHFFDNPALIGGDVAGVANDWGLVIANGRVGFGAVSGQTTFTGNQYNDGNWHYATVTRVGPTGAMKVYINGSLQAQMIEAPGVDLTASPTLRIGGDPSNGQEYTGYIGEVDFWQIALTAEQITSNFNAQRGAYGV